MTMKTFACQFCVFVLLIAVGVNAISLTSCSDALENEVCGITCNTTDHLQNVAFYKLPDTGSVIAQCVPGSGCFGPSQYDIAQPNSVSTILSFMHSRQQASEWRCDYGLNFAVVNVSWATYPQNVSTTMTSNTQVNADIHVNATLECLYSAQNPTVTLQYENSNGKIDATSETFKCEDTPVACTDGNFTTYACPVIIAAESGINHSDTYSIQLKTTVSNVQTEDVKTIATGITFERSGDTNASTDNYGTAIGILSGCLVIAYIIVIIALRVYIGSTRKTSGNCFLTFCQFIQGKCFDCCGNKFSQGIKGDTDFFKDKVLTLNSLLGFTYLVVYGVIVGVIVLPVVYYGFANFQEGLVIGWGIAIVLALSCLCLVVVWILIKFVNNGASGISCPLCCIRNCTVMPHEPGKSQKKAIIDKRQQPDGDEGHQSTPKDPDARHLTTERPLPPKPDIASPQTGSVDSVNSPKRIVLAPTENPNILPSIDTLDEPKMDKKPTEKKKKKKKKKDEGQDNPAYVQDNNVMT